MSHESDPDYVGYPTLKRLHGKICPRLRGLPGLADRATRLGGSPHLSCKRDQIKMRGYMDRLVTPPKWVTLPTWGPPPPCKQALSFSHWRDVQIEQPQLNNDCLLRLIAAIYRMAELQSYLQNI